MGEDERGRDSREGEGGERVMGERVVHVGPQYCVSGPPLPRPLSSSLVLPQRSEKRQKGSEEESEERRR